MAAGGSLAPAGLLWLCLAPAALPRLHQPQSVVVVEPGASVEIGCEANQDLESELAVSWYRRGKGGPDLVLGCESRRKGRFSCTYGRHNVTLHIASAHPNDTSLYLCAHFYTSYWVFGSGTTLLVGDSWRAGSWARVLAPRGAPQAPPSPVCAVGATAGPVLVSWPGGPRGVLGLGGGTGPLVSPMGTAGGAGGLCEVSFNTSGSPVRRSVELHGATGSCVTPGTWVLAGAGVLLLLSLCLSIRRLRRLRRPTPMGHRPGTPMPPASQEDEGGLTYAQLSFAAPAGPTP